MKRSSLRFPFRFSVLLLVSLSLLLSLSSPRGLSQTKGGGDEYGLSALEKAVLEEMNLARTNPALYLTYLEAQRKYYKGKKYMPPGGGSLEKVEGESALEDAIAYMRTVKPLAPLQLSKGMCMGAKDQSFDQSKTGDVSHQGKDKTFSWERVGRYGEWKNPISENIAYDSGTARDIVINLIIDDGVPSRGHRRNIFNSSHIVTGVSCANHPLYGNMCVCTFAGGFTEKSQGGAGTSQPATSAPAAPKARKL